MILPHSITETSFQKTLIIKKLVATALFMFESRELRLPTNLFRSRSTLEFLLATHYKIDIDILANKAVLCLNIRNTFLIVSSCGENDLLRFT